MIYRTLGRTGYNVSALGLGGFQFTGFFGVAPQEADNIIDYAIEHGVNLIDTAQAYGFGEGEAIVGRALARHQTDRPYVCAKVGHLHELISRARGDAAFQDPDEIMRNIKHSMWVMRVDCFDMLLIHELDRQWHANYDTGDAVVTEVLEQCKKDGLTKFIGAASWDTNALARMIKTDRVDVVMSAGGISLLSRPICDELLPAAQSHNVGVMVGGCLGQNNPGLVSIRRDAADRFMKSEDPKLAMLGKKLNGLYDIAEEQGLNMIQMALRYVMSNEQIHSDPMGAREVAHIADNIRTAEMGVLPADVVEKINAVQDMGESYDGLELATMVRTQHIFD